MPRLEVPEPLIDQARRFVELHTEAREIVEALIGRIDALTRELLRCSEGRPLPITDDFVTRRTTGAPR